jgi:Fe-S-cluster-containing dehydrogenase component/DMSO reductase anchor subunit
VQLGFLIDQRSCIGCHACTVACKAENGVAIGDFRTWVKYVESGTFPDTQRHFAVMRCNHCATAPCVRICPVRALEKRADGIVDLDREACIGCGACMQACPYDALYVDEDSGTAGKCHFCAHRLARNLEPACVAVCPTRSLHVIDLHDRAAHPTAALLAQDTAVRRPECRTGPNVHYLGASPLALTPTAADRPIMWQWAERAPWRPEPWPASAPSVSGAHVVLEPVHRVRWGWPVSAFVLAKATAAGVAALAPFAGVPLWHAAAAALTAIVVASVLLVADLGRPERAWTMLTRPNPRSWLVRGALFLTVFGSLQAGALVAGLFGSGAVRALAIGGALLAPCVAGYTAGLFGQCVGRDSWRSLSLLPRLLLQAVACGGALLAALGAQALSPWVALALLALLALAIFERRVSHSTDAGRTAAAFHRALRPLGVSPLVALVLALAVTLLLAFAPSLTPLLPFVVGSALLLEEHAWLRAGQLVPNS